MRTSHAAATLLVLALAGCGGDALTKQQLVATAAGEDDTAEVQRIGVDAQKAQDEYRRLTGRIGFKECGGGV